MLMLITSMLMIGCRPTEEATEFGMANIQNETNTTNVGSEFDFSYLESDMIEADPDLSDEENELACLERGENWQVVYDGSENGPVLGCAEIPGEEMPYNESELDPIYESPVAELPEEPAPGGNCQGSECLDVILEDSTDPYAPYYCHKDNSSELKVDVCHFNKGNNKPNSICMNLNGWLNGHDPTPGVAGIKTKKSHNKDGREDHLGRCNKADYAFYQKS
tara:strand:+ start:8857 stop:9516 length:660 start_codon:yes stop_codon:yes gene_type:complete